MGKSRKSRLRNTLMMSEQENDNNDDVEVKIRMEATRHSFIKEISHGRDIGMMDMIFDFAVKVSDKHE